MLTAEDLRQMHKPAQATSATPQEVRQDRGIVPATEKQAEFIRKLLAERVGMDGVEEIRERLNTWRASGTFSKVAASKTINDLLFIEVPSTRHPFPNRKAQDCDLCHRQVEVGEGLCSRDDADAQWVVVHLDGECISDFPFPEGRYALVEEGEVKFFVANESGLFAQASSDLFPVKGARRQTIIDLIAVDPRAAAILYGKELGVCGICGRTLTSEWRKAGIGPVCSGKAAF